MRAPNSTTLRSVAHGAVGTVTTPEYLTGESAGAAVVPDVSSDTRTKVGAAADAVFRSLLPCSNGTRHVLTSLGDCSRTYELSGKGPLAQQSGCVNSTPRVERGAFPALERRCSSAVDGNLLHPDPCQDFPSGMGVIKVGRTHQSTRRGNLGTHRMGVQDALAGPSGT